MLVGGLHEVRGHLLNMHSEVSMFQLNPLQLYLIRLFLP